MPPDDRIRLAHMMEAAEIVATIVAGRRRSDLDADKPMALALARAIEIMGEAASRLSPELRTAVPAVPWGRMVAMRNRLVHAYFDVDHDVLWSTATEDIPALLPVLRSLADRG